MEAVNGSAGRLRRSRRAARRRGSASSAGYLIGPLFAGMAAWFLWGPSLLDIPHPPVRTVDTSRLTTGPRRHALGDPPVLHIDGFDRTCMDCHRLFTPPEDTPIPLMQHRHIHLDHGINDRCRNCHYDKDRDKLVLRGGKVIPFGDVVELCAKCHGPTFRDWQRGAHGRTNGYWDSTRGTVRRLLCTECHDPHNPRVPAMDPLEPLPGPHTIRMGKDTPAEKAAEEQGDRRDPLRRSLEH